MRNHSLLMYLSRLSLLLPLCWWSTGQAQDFYHEAINVSYQSRFEEIVMEAPFKDTEEGKLRLFMASVPGSNFAAVNELKQQLDQLYRELDALNLKPQQLSKTLHQVDHFLRKHYLKQYDPFSNITAIFAEQRYNTVTATALYTLILDYLNFPYQLISKDAQAYPQVGTEKILVGYRKHTKDKPARLDQQAEDFATLLKALHLIEEEEAERKKPDALYREYYGAGPEVIDFTQLGGMLYYQSALQHYFRKRYQQAAQDIDKAQLLYPSMRNQVVKYAALYQQAAAQSEETSADLLTLYVSHRSPVIRQEVIRRFVKLTERYLYETRQPAQLKQQYEVVLGRLTEDPALQAELKTIYDQQVAAYQATLFQNTQLSHNLDSLYDLYPNNVDIQQQLGNLLMFSLSKERDFAVGLDRLADYRTRYPFIIVNPYFKDLELFYSAERIRATFGQNRPGLGQKYLEDFETLLQQHGHTLRADSWITTAFITASFYYYRNKDYPNARRMIQRGLTHLPESDYFTHRMELLRRY